MACLNTLVKFQASVMSSCWENETKNCSFKAEIHVWKYESMFTSVESAGEKTRCEPFLNLSTTPLSGCGGSFLFLLKRS